MAKTQRKEPWNKKVNDNNYENQDYYQEEKQEVAGRKSRTVRQTSVNVAAPKKKSKKSGVGSTIFLTFLVAIMFAIIGGAVIFTIWNNRNANMATIASSFSQSGQSSAVSSSSAAAESSSSSSTSTSSSSTSTASKTYTVQGGDYPSLIASNTGVTWDTIVKLNPTLDANNPGYYKDGSQIEAGQTLIIAK
ncbi:MAG: LysM peptidoglycan-binding domain-containing protein [Streptococcaceae bacterium]|jgi:LysM repeat protein|nr:LysM peptidoglycan-binding domain-containing protein [Streptococcaceae bacterium]